MMLRPNQGMGDPNAARRSQMLQQLLAGGPAPAPQPSPTAGMAQGMQQMARDPEFMKWFQTLLPRTGGVMQGPAPQGMPINPMAGGQMPGLY
jgi:hypothetical protein